ncbi:MAG: tRNA (adenosine(37)-N6)-threonylcarbamoyltransferase complex ATPase subunit type 1 TsaE [Lachnospiraceae bacterium]|nr:tRNA (adenosine(37)-N6)-threonylcarbamoyltransferase complex ATPase subunit type 1 TsaE [Lachnospiraceae bacterium]
MEKLDNTEFDSLCPDDTYEFAKKLGEQVSAGDVICLIGDLGVGKTLFSQGFAKGLGVEEYVNSPTFTIVQEYEGKDERHLTLYHFDVYRIEDSYEMDEVGFTDMIYGDGVSLIEWADLIEDILPDTYTKVTICKDLEKGFDYRKITVEVIR